MAPIHKAEFSFPFLREHYERIDHPSGLRIYVCPKERSGTYAILAVRFGSVDVSIPSEDGKTERIPDGTAHFLEHKLFENPDGSDSFARFSELGADANAQTSSDRTAYLFECTDRFGESLTELLTFVLHPAFNEESIRRERGIIAEEIRMYRDDPWERGYQNLLRALYRVHPVKREICGSEKSIRQITPGLLDRCYRHYYEPSNMILSVCGNVTAEDVLRIVDRVLPRAASDRTIPTPRIPVNEPSEVAVRYVETKMTVSQPIFHIGIKDTGVPSDAAARLRREIAMDLLNEILFSQSGTFYGTLLEEGKVKPSFGGSYISSDDYGFHCVSGESGCPEEILERVREHLQKTAKEGIAPSELERCRRILFSDEIRGYDSTEEIAERMLDAAFDGTDLYFPFSVYADITAGELTSLTKELLDGDRIAFR